MDKLLGDALVSPHDYRDGIAASAIAAELANIVLPATFHTDLGSVLDQNKTPSCVAHDVIMLLRLYWFRELGVWIDFSPRFLDILVKRIDGQDRETGGTYPRYVLKLAATIGCCTTKLLPNDTFLSTLEYRNDDLITDEMLEEAAKYKIPGYVNVPLDPLATRQHIYLYGALTSLFVIGDEFWTPSWQTKDIDPVTPPKNSLSGHQLAPCGWDDPVLNRGRNEWGKEWNMNGEFHYDPIKWKGFIFEQWAIAKIPTDVSAFLKTLPSQANFHYNWYLNLKRGDFSEAVKMAQVAYMILGYLKPLTPDEFGHFGPKMAAANYAFQSTNGIKVPSADNIGPATRALLNKKFAL